MKKLGVIGNRYGKLVVLSEHSKTRNGHIRYRCECDCGQKSDVLGTHLRQGNTTSCGCASVKRGDRHRDWNGEGQISGGFWYDHIVRSATGSKGRREIELTIDKGYAWNLFQQQDGRCALSSLPLTFPAFSKDKSWTASLDRIDSSLGYVEGNVQWVHKDINMMKNKFTQEHFIKMCKLVAGGACEINL